MDSTSTSKLDPDEWLKSYLQKSKLDFEANYAKNIQSSPTESVKNFTLIKTLGSGSFGRVLLAHYANDTTKKGQAIKVIGKERVVKTKQTEHTKNEKRILFSTNHPFIVVLTAAFKDTTNLYMVMEFASGGELFLLIRKKGKLPEAWSQFYSAQVLLALQYLHNANILYRDLKPENILLDQQGYVKVADFGFAKRVPNGYTWTLCGTPQYLAPEMILSKGYGKSIDYWGYGILIYEMCAGHVPFDHKQPIKLYELIVECKLEFPSAFKFALTDLLAKIIQTSLSATATW